MKTTYTLQRTIPQVLEAIKNAKDIDEVNHYGNIMVSMYSSMLLYFAAIANFLLYYIIDSQIIHISLYNSFIFLALGLAYDVVIRANVKTNSATLIISTLSFISLVFVAHHYYPIIGPAIWTIVFIQLLFTMMRMSKTMMFFVIAGVLIANIYTLHYSFHNLEYNLSPMYYIIQFTLLILLCVIALAVHKINSDRYYSIDEQLQILRKNKETIDTLYDEIKLLAYHDHLTGLPNRLYLSERIEHAISLANRTNNMLAIMYLDLDDFKMINDTMGHAVGDQLLVDVSKRLKSALRKSDTIARIGGDEFNIMIENVESYDSIKIIANKIIQCFHSPFLLDGQECFMTTSIGISVYPADGSDAQVLGKNADIAMYKAKEKNKNQYIFCTEAMKSQVSDTMKLTNNLYRALERNELEVYYQPQVNSSLNQIVGLEALIRWNHKELGMIYPEEFIPIAEKTGLIYSIGEWVIRTACRQNKAWQDAGYPYIPVAVNLSALQFQDSNIIKQIEDILKETNLDPQYLELEITESIALKGKTNVIKTIKTFKDMGIHITIDDFGTEYSSLDYLKKLPADRIKIDMSFIHGIEISKKDESIIKAIITLARNMNLNIIAEGVEEKKQLDFLTREMCDQVQGFYYFKPMPANILENVLKESPFSVNE